MIEHLFAISDSSIELSGLSVDVQESGRFLLRSVQWCPQCFNILANGAQIHIGASAQTLTCGLDSCSGHIGNFRASNASDGSLRDRTKLATEQEESVQIMSAAGIAASRTNKLSEKDLSVKYPATRSIDVRELFAKPESQAKALVEEFGRVMNMLAGSARVADQIFRESLLA
jgi:hypothetical protein